MVWSRRPTSSNREENFNSLSLKESLFWIIILILFVFLIWILVEGGKGSRAKKAKEKK
jgi:hypothetical protein